MRDKQAEIREFLADGPPTEVHLVIGSEGFSDERREVIVVYASLDRDAAVAERERLEALIPVRAEEIRTWQRRRGKRLKELTELCTGYPIGSSWVHTPEGSHHTYRPWPTISREDAASIEGKLQSEFGDIPESLADEYTVLSVPFDRAGRWDVNE